MESKTKTNMGRDNAHPNVCSKSNNNEGKILTHHEIHHCGKNCVSDHSSV